MPCRTIRLSDGRMVIACGPRIRRPSPRRCSACGQPETRCSIRLCDGAVTRGNTRGTCDVVLCTDCAVHVEPDLDYCRQHAP